MREAVDSDNLKIKQEVENNKCRYNDDYNPQDSHTSTMAMVRNNHVMVGVLLGKLR